MKYKRKKLNLSVKRSFQLWLLTRVMGTVLVCSVLSGLILYYYASKELADSFFDVHIEVQRLSDILLPVIVSGSAISFVSGLLMALFLPQKIAGPLYRIEEDLKQIQDGDLHKVIKLRHDDPLHGFVKTLNTTITGLTVRVEEAEERLNQVLGDGGDNV